VSRPFPCLSPRCSATKRRQKWQFEQLRLHRILSINSKIESPIISYFSLKVRYCGIILAHRFLAQTGGPDGSNLESSKLDLPTQFKLVTAGIRLSLHQR
jgi:hypothetical protein